MTAADLIRLALRDAGVNGVGQYPNAEDNNDCLTHLNMMLGEWSAQRFLCYHLIDAVAQATGAATYSVGPGGAFVSTTSAEPVNYVDRIEAAFWRSFTNPAQPVDYPLAILEAREDWDQVAVKNVGTWPTMIFFDSDTPLGYVYPWPIPLAGTGEIHLSLRVALPQVVNLTDDFVFPQAYLNALLWNLAERIRPMYQLEPDKSVSGFAKAALNVIRTNNAQVPRLRMPVGLNVQRGRYNIYSDQLR